MGLFLNAIPSDAIKFMAKYSPELFPDSLIILIDTNIKFLVDSQIQNKKYSKTTLFSENFFTLNGRLLRIYSYRNRINSMSKKILFLNNSQYKGISVRK